MRELVIATRNKGKIHELMSLLSSIDVQLIDLAEAGVDVEASETGKTFEENALLKAREYARASGRSVLADDSGLEVDALDGAPGVNSARYGGTGLTDAERVEYLLHQMSKIPGWCRQARFRTVLAIVHFERPEYPEVICGEVNGAITHHPLGTNGFGYDPVFWLPWRASTMAELSEQEKGEISHRGAAARAAIPVLRRSMGQ